MNSASSGDFGSRSRYSVSLGAGNDEWLPVWREGLALTRLKTDYRMELCCLTEGSYKLIVYVAREMLGKNEDDDKVIASVYRDSIGSDSSPKSPRMGTGPNTPMKFRSLVSQMTFGTFGKLEMGFEFSVSQGPDTLVKKKVSVPLYETCEIDFDVDDEGIASGSLKISSKSTVTTLIASCFLFKKLDTDALQSLNPDASAEELVNTDASSEYEAILDPLDQVREQMHGWAIIFIGFAWGWDCRSVESAALIFLCMIIFEQKFQASVMRQPFQTQSRMKSYTSF